MSKIYCVPGWRCGWLICYNNNGYFDKVLDNLGRLTMVTLHPSNLITHAVPAILKNTPDSFFTNLKSNLGKCSSHAY